MDINLKTPATVTGLLVYSLVVLAIVYFTATAGGAALGAIVAAVVLGGIVYLAYVLGGRIHDRMRHGKPIRRKGGEN